MTRFFVPLAVQAASQSLTYPLVAMVASRASGGTLNLAGMAQALAVMGLLNTISAGMLTTGMVYATNRQGYQRYCQVNNLMAMAVIALQALLCIPPVAEFLFGRLIGLSPAIRAPAELALLSSIPLNLLFFLRCPSQVILYNNRATARAGGATMGRILLTALLSPVFCTLGLTGLAWAMVCLTLPVALETVVSYAFARDMVRRLPEAAELPPRRREVFFFNLPLSLGGLFLALSGFMLGAFIARAPLPEQMLPVYYLAAGLISPVSFGATRLQAVVLAFPPAAAWDRRTLRFSLIAGFAVGLLPLLALMPAVAELYFVAWQKLPAADLPLVRQTMLAMVAVPLCVAWRAQAEGLAAFVRKPVAVLTGQAVYLGALVSIAFCCLGSGIAGNLIAPVGLIVANLASGGITRYSLRLEAHTDFPVSTTSAGPEAE